MFGSVSYFQLKGKGIKSKYSTALNKDDLLSKKTKNDLNERWTPNIVIEISQQQLMKSASNL